MLVVVTGTPGTGKTRCASILAKKTRARIIHLRKFVKEKGLAEGRDARMKSELVDLRKLGRELKKEIAKLDVGRGAWQAAGNTRLETRNRKLIVEGHLACEIPLPADYVFVLRCEPRELGKRLERRRYLKEKINENLLSEMLDYCLQQSEANFPKARIVQVETAGRKAEETAGIMLRALSGKKIKKECINYTGELKKHLGLKNG